MAERPSGEENAKWHRWFAIECNNHAWQLAESEIRDAAQDAEMLHCAHAAAYHWGVVGNEVNVARAASLLAQVHALLGNADLAHRYAEQNLTFVTGRDSEDWERAFAYAISAHAAALGRDTAKHAEYHTQARSIGETLGKEDREIFNKTFRTIPAPSC